MNINTLTPKQASRIIADAEYDKKILQQKINSNKGLRCNMYKAQYRNRESVISSLQKIVAASPAQTLLS